MTEQIETVIESIILGTDKKYNARNTLMRNVAPKKCGSGSGMSSATSSFLHIIVIIGVIFISARAVSSNDNGLALTPPMGWRSWNQYGADISQPLMERIMDGVVDRSRLDHTGSPTSLCDLGYCDVGLDDNWQACDHPSAAPGMHYHDVEGYPIVNLTTFSSLKSMTEYAHSLNLTAGFYGNNCICADHCRNESECDMQIRADVEAFVDWGFDSWKLDGCGGQNDLSLFDEYLRQMSPDKAIMVENCHWGKPEFDPDPNVSPREGCPWNFYRSSGDIGLSYESVLANLASVDRYRAMNASVPQCWAYPDMLQVGIRRKDDGVIGLSKAETRTHFGAWCIVSSPLFLSHDVADVEVNDHIWDIISNQEAIAVNQAYNGDSGGVYEISTSMIYPGEKEKFSSFSSVSTSNRILETVTPATFPSYQYLSKPLGGGKVAVLLINSLMEPAELTARFDNIPGLSCGNNEGYSVRNIWMHSDEGVAVEDSWSIAVEGHDAAFLIVECAH